MPRPRVHGLESYKDIPIDHPLRRKIQNRNAQRTFRRKRSASNGQDIDQPTNEQGENTGADTKTTSGGTTSSGVEAEGQADTINVEPWVAIPTAPSPQDMNINTLESQQDGIGPSALDQLATASAMSHVDATSGSFSRPEPHPHLETGFLDPVDLYTNNPTISDQERFSMPFTMNDDVSRFEFRSEWQPSQPPIQVQTSKPPRKHGSRRSSHASSNKVHSKSARPNSSKSDPTTDSSLLVLGDTKYSARNRPRLDVLNSPCPSGPARGVAASRLPATVTRERTGSSVTAASNGVTPCRPPPSYQNRSQQSLSTHAPSNIPLPPHDPGGSEIAAVTNFKLGSTNNPQGYQHQAQYQQPQQQHRQMSPTFANNTTLTSHHTSPDYPREIRHHRNSIAFSMGSNSAETASGSGAYDDGTGTPTTSMNSSRASSPLSSIINAAATTKKPAPGPVISETSASSSITNGSSSDNMMSGGDQSWRHIIHTCCEVGHLSLVEELIESGLDLDKRDSAGNTPLHIAANSGHEDVMAYLLEKGCDVNAVNHAGWTAAHLATVKGHRGCLRLLLEVNASPWARVNTSST